MGWFIAPDGEEESRTKRNRNNRTNGNNNYNNDRNSSNDYYIQPVRDNGFFEKTKKAVMPKVNGVLRVFNKGDEYLSSESDDKMSDTLINKLQRINERICFKDKNIPREVQIEAANLFKKIKRKRKITSYEDLCIAIAYALPYCLEDESINNIEQINAKMLLEVDLRYLRITGVVSLKLLFDFILSTNEEIRSRVEDCDKTEVTKEASVVKNARQKLKTPDQNVLSVIKNNGWLANADLMALANSALPEHTYQDFLYLVKHLNDNNVMREKELTEALLLFSNRLVPGMNNAVPSAEEFIKESEESKILEGRYHTVSYLDNDILRKLAGTYKEDYTDQELITLGMAMDATSGSPEEEVKILEAFKTETLKGMKNYLKESDKLSIRKVLSMQAYRDFQARVSLHIPEDAEYAGVTEETFFTPEEYTAAQNRNWAEADFDTCLTNVCSYVDKLSNEPTVKESTYNDVVHGGLVNLGKLAEDLNIEGLMYEEEESSDNVAEYSKYREEDAKYAR